MRAWRSKEAGEAFGSPSLFAGNSGTELQGIMADNNPPPSDWQMFDNRHFDLERRVVAIETTLESIDRVQQEIRAALQKKDTPWGALAGWASVLLGIGAAVYAPIWANQKITREDISVVEGRLNSAASNRWTSENQREFEREYRSAERIQDNRMINLEKEVSYLRGRVGDE